MARVKLPVQMTGKWLKLLFSLRMHAKRHTPLPLSELTHVMIVLTVRASQTLCAKLLKLRININSNLFELIIMCWRFEPQTYQSAQSLS